MFASKEESLRAFYHTLYDAWGPQHWWPARSRFEVIAGAYLTQNTSWTNVAIALKQLRGAGRLSLDGIRTISLSELETLIRSSGYFRQKAARLKLFVAFLDEKYGGSLDRMFAQPTERLRKELLELTGVGPETADAILLYGGQHPVFVVDAYTRRILSRHELSAEDTSYEDIRLLFQRSLEPVGSMKANLRERGAENSFPGTGHSPSRMSLRKRSAVAQIYNDMHGLLVGVGKHFCLKSKPLCEQCPLRQYLPRPID